MAIQFSPFGTYVPVTGTVDATAKTEIQTNFDGLKALIPDGSEGSSPAEKPGFDVVRPDWADKILKEIDHIAGLVAAA